MAMTTFFLWFAAWPSLHLETWNVHTCKHQPDFMCKYSLLFITHISKRRTVGCLSCVCKFASLFLTKQCWHLWMSSTNGASTHLDQMVTWRPCTPGDGATEKCRDTQYIIQSCIPISMSIWLIRYGPCLWIRAFESGNPDFRIIRISGFPDFRIAGNPDIRISGFPNMRISRYLDFRIFE